MSVTGLARALRERVAGRTGEREDDDKGAGAEQGFAAGNLDVHGASLYACAEARLTARTMRAWVPQRHRLLASAFLISASLGFLFLARKAADCMTMPLMQ